MKKYSFLFLFFSALFLVSAHGENSLGINTHILSDDVYEAVAAASIPWVRIDIDWYAIEPNQGQFNWGEIDRVVNKARSLNLKIFATFAYTPQWASSGNKDGKANNNDVPKPGLYEKALSEAVKRYRGRIYHWGLWNEVNLEGFWEGSADQYVDLIVIPGYNVIKKECPECYVLGPELANVGDKLNDFYNTIFSRAKDKFDIITHHIYQTFPELDPWAGYTSDSFFNALEKKRTFSNRMALYEALTKYGITNKDVWITETGYRCEPPTDQSEMNNQRLYYELVLKAQIEREWWTNTFFYEIYDCGTDIPNCSIDGYGILRRTSPPDNSYQDNFLFKPAYYYLKEFMDQHPEFKGLSDVDAGFDTNLIDVSVDSGYSDTGFVERKRVKAVNIMKEPKIDGDLGDFIMSNPVVLGSKDYVRITSGSGGDGDISARFFFMWSTNKLFIGIIVKDDVSYNTESPENIWKGDSVQIAFDADFDRTEGSYDNDGDYEMGFAIVNGSPVTYRWVSPISAKPMKVEVGYKKSGDETIYEIAIPFDQISPFTFKFGNMAGISFLVNDNDGSGREGFIQFAGGIGLTKDPSQFGELVLGGGVCEVENICSDSRDCLGLQPICNCPGKWECNGRNMCEWICEVPDIGVSDTVIYDSTIVDTHDFIYYDTTGDIQMDVISEDALVDMLSGDLEINEQDEDIVSYDISISKHEDAGGDSDRIEGSSGGCGCTVIE